MWGCGLMFFPPIYIVYFVISYIFTIPCFTTFMLCCLTVVFIIYCCSCVIMPFCLNSLYITLLACGCVKSPL